MKLKNELDYIKENWEPMILPAPSDRTKTIYISANDYLDDFFLTHFVNKKGF